MKSVPVDIFSASQLTDCALRAPLMHPLPVDKLCLGPAICQLGRLQGLSADFEESSTLLAILEPPEAFWSLLEPPPGVPPL